VKIKQSQGGKKMRKLILASICICMASFGWAQSKPHGILNLTTVNVKIDGKVDADEYPTNFVDSKTGIGVSWVSDGKLLYVALQSPAPGWVAIAFGNSKIRGTSMFIGYHKPGGGRVDEHVGSWVSTHRPIDKPSLVNFATGSNDKGTVIEFVMPLTLSNGQVIVPGQPMQYVVAYHKKKTSFKGRPSIKNTGTLLLGKPERADEAPARTIQPPDTTAKADEK
jgi:hypothetical protein